MINLDNVKIVLFDFDDTLCIHKNHNYTEEGARVYHKNILKIRKDVWNDCDMNSHMLAFMDECMTKGIELGLISQCTSFKHMQYKHDWVQEKYGFNLNNYCVGTYEDKIKIMIAISDAFEILPEQILIVDDFWETVTKATNNGFQSCTPMEVINYIEQNKLK